MAMRKVFLAIAVVAILAMPQAVMAFTYDVSITHAAITFTPATFFLNDHVRIYATVKNVGDRDVGGMVFFSENGTAVGTPQYFSARAHAAEEDVWVEWQPAVEGDRQIFVRVVTDPETRDENTSNNEMIVPLYIDRDTDGDRIGDRDDPDDDNDGLSDAWEIAHGLNSKDARDAALDPDGDGRTTIEEYRAGTDPFVRPPTPPPPVAPLPPPPVLKSLVVEKPTPVVRAPSVPVSAPVATSRTSKKKTPPASVKTVPTAPSGMDIERLDVLGANSVDQPVIPKTITQSDDEVRRLLGDGSSWWRPILPWIMGIIALGALGALGFLLFRARKSRSE